MEHVWENEPDEAIFESDGFKCRIKRVPGMGHLCGYVGVPESHPWFNKNYDDVDDIYVHGGLTYSEHGHSDLFGLWVFGFDCAHSGDLIPDSVMRYGICGQHDTYRDFEYVKRETESLARQLAAVTGA
jgi:hypothetical protein